MLYLLHRLTCSYEMAQLVERLDALDLAEFIYRKVDAHYEVASCLLQAGNFKRVIIRFLLNK